MSKKSRRVIYENFRRNAGLFFRSKLGATGFAIIMFFSILAILAPFITSNDPIFGYNVSSPYSVPVWATVIPKYQNLPLTLFISQSNSFLSNDDLQSWHFSGQNFTVKVSTSGPPGNLSSLRGSLLVNATLMEQNKVNNPYLPDGQVIFSMTKTFEYESRSPYSFDITTYIDFLSMKNISGAYVNYVISGPNGSFSLGSVQTYVTRSLLAFSPNDVGQWRNITYPSGLLPTSGIREFLNVQNPPSLIFRKGGMYNFTLQVLVIPKSSNPTISFLVTGVNVHIFGRVYGLLGTDIYGRDLWSQFVWGSRISLLVGILSALGSVIAGTVVGLVAGLAGGIIDEIVSRITDFVLVLPFLPLAIVVVFIVGQNPILFQGVYYWIILLFVAVSWPSVARVIRSQVLSVKERQFVEASRALGAGNWHIMWKHILPNVMGLVYSQTALSVPGFILTEAALDFLAVGIHPINTITWGIMLTGALNDALTNSTVDYAWWWFLPPGIAIAVLSLAFVMVGFALDSIFNPKLRLR